MIDIAYGITCSNLVKISSYWHPYINVLPCAGAGAVVAGGNKIITVIIRINDEKR